MFHKLIFFLLLNEAIAELIFLSKGNADESENIIFKCNFASLQSFVDYPKLCGLRTV